MFDTVFGLPVHPLVVHAVVVLVPLAAVLVVAMALRPGWRTGPFAWLAVLLVLGATAATPVATQSGQALAERVGEPEQHAAFGEALVYFLVPLLVLTLVLVLLAARSRRAARTTGSSPRSLVTTLVAVAAAVAAVAAVVQVAVVGHSGATATWANVVASG